MTSLKRSPRSVRRRASRVISYATPMTRLVSGSKLESSRNCVMGIGAPTCQPRNNWSGPLRSGWTRFILSLLFRNPEAVATIKGHIIQMWDEGTKALQADYAARRRAGDPETVEE